MPVANSVADQTTLRGSELRQAIWEELQRAVADRDHPWRTPVLANVDDQGMPQARTVVLREAEPGQQRLLIYTDHRSPKVTELADQPRAVLVFWSKPLGWQLRVSVDTSVETGGQLVDEAWESVSQTAAAADYLSLQAPGSPLLADAGDQAAGHALGVVIARVRSIDWLALHPQGHRRARLDDDGVQWLVP